mgnify:CR=1 FL=1
MTSEQRFESQGSLNRRDFLPASAVAGETSQLSAQFLELTCRHPERFD